MSKIRKAIAAALVAFLAVLPLALADGSLNHVEIVNLVGAVVVAGYAVFKIPNEPAAKIPNGRGTP
jgi:hypothetical protein